MSDRPLYRIGAVSAVAGSILGMVVNALHPRTPEIANPEALMEEVARSSIWVPDHVGIVFAVLLILGGLVAISRSVEGPTGSAFARLGLAGALVGSSVMIVQMGVDGIARYATAVDWMNAPAAEKAIAFGVGKAVHAIGAGLFSLWVIVLFGVTYILFGLAVALGEGYPRWLGWVAVVTAIGLVLVGVSESFTGYSNLTTNILFPILAFVITVWVLVIGILMWRKAAAMPAV